MARAFPERSECPEVPDNDAIGTLNLNDPSEPADRIIQTRFFTFPPPEPPNFDFGCYGPTATVSVSEASSAAGEVDIEYPNEDETGRCEPRFNFDFSVPPCVTASTEASIQVSSELADPAVEFEASRKTGDPCAWDFRFNLNLPGFCPTVRTDASISINASLSDPTVEFVGERDPLEPCRFNFDLDIQLPEFGEDDVCQARLATTGNISLSGLQTVDGVAASEDDVILVRAQSTGSQNGAYRMKSGAWERTCDMSRAGIIVTVREGAEYAGTAWLLSTNDPISVGSTPLTFTLISGSTCCCSARVATLEDITLSGLQTIDGVSVAEDDIVLVKNQGSESENGPYLVKDGAAWERTCEVFSGHTVSVREGTYQKQTVWMLTTDGAIELDTTGLTYRQVVDRPMCRVASGGHTIRSTTRTIDGVATSVDDIVLLMNQNNPAQNGLYLVKSGSWVRTGDITPGMIITVQEGAVYGGQSIVLSTADPITVGTTNLTFSPLRMVVRAYVALDKGPFGQPAQGLTGTPDIDDITTQAGDVVLVFNSSTPANNGVWVVPGTGAWQEAMPGTTGFAGTIVSVREGNRFGQVSFMILGGADRDIWGITGVVGPNTI